jgi:hypothetical protein
MGHAMTWHKLASGVIVMTADRPATERLPDGRWVSGFDVLPAGDPLVAEAGWVQSADPTAQPDDTSRVWRWAWTVDAGTVTGSWVDDGPAPTPTPTAEDRLAALAAAVAEAEAVETIADMEALREALAAALGGQ